MAYGMRLSICGALDNKTARVMAQLAKAHNGISENVIVIASIYNQLIRVAAWHRAQAARARYLIARHSGSSRLMAVSAS